MSAPVVSGVAGLIISQGMDRGFNLINNDVRHILELTAVDIAPTGFDNETGFGIVNANNALQLLDEPNELYHYNSIGGSSQKIANIEKWILSGNYYGLAAGMYLDVDQYKITKHITFEVPFCSIPQVWMRERQSACMSGASPNSGRPYSSITNITTTGFDLEYFVYYVRSNTLGKTLNQWYPASPSLSNVAYTAVGEPNIAATAGSLTGANIICSSGASYTIQNLPDGATITWEKSSNISRDSQQGSNPCEFSATSNGEGWVEATVSVPNGCETYTLPRKTVWVGAPDLDNITVYYTDDLNQYGEYCPGETNELLARPDPSIDMGITDNYWDLGNWNVYDEDGEGYVFFGIPTSFSGSEELSYEISNSCNTAIGTITLYEGNCGGYYMFISPNPSSGETTISLGSTENDSGILKSASTESTFDETAEWDLEVYDSMQSLKLKKQKLKGKSTSINTQSWKEGVYMVRASYKGEILTGKLVVKK